jgi:polyphenol oxidase
VISDNNTLTPSWRAPAHVRALCTTRKGGISLPPWEALNLGGHVNDNPDHVAENRNRLAAFTGLDATNIGWLNQVHGTGVLELTPDNVDSIPEADASYTRHPGIACAILTADCLPVILADTDGTIIGAAHAGWRSLCGGVLENLITAMAVPPSNLQAWLGPAIGPDSFQVGPEVRQAFLDHNPEADQAFTPSKQRPGHYLANIYQLASQRLKAAGVASISGGSLCTVNDSDWFFSYRRDGETGRMATLIWKKS